MEDRPVNKMRMPMYIKFKNSINKCCLKKQFSGEYYRPAGVWWVHVEVKSGKLFISELLGSSPVHHLNGLELERCSREEFEKDNEGHI